MQRDAVHRGGHGVLADAIVDVAAVEGSRRRTGCCVLARVRLEWVRSAEPPSKFGKCLGDPVDHQLRRLPGRDVRPLGCEAVAQAAPSPRHSRRADFDSAHRETATARPGFVRLVRSIQLGGGMPARTDLAPLLEDGLRNLERLRAASPAQRGSLRPPRRRAARHGLFRCPGGSARRNRSWCGRRSATAGRCCAPVRWRLRSLRDRGRRSGRPTIPRP